MVGVNDLAERRLPSNLLFKTLSHSWHQKDLGGCLSEENSVLSCSIELLLFQAVLTRFINSLGGIFEYQNHSSFPACAQTPEPLMVRQATPDTQEYTFKDVGRSDKSRYLRLGAQLCFSPNVMYCKPE